MFAIQVCREYCYECYGCVCAVADGLETLCFHWLKQGAVVMPVPLSLLSSCTPFFHTAPQLASLLSAKYSCGTGEHSMALSSLHQHPQLGIIDIHYTGHVCQLTAQVGAQGLEKTVI